MSILSKLPIAPSKGRGEVLTLSDPTVAALAAEWISAKRDLQSAETGVDITAAAVIPHARAEWFRGNVGRARPVGSVEIPSVAGTLLASFASVWSPKGGMDLIPAHLRRERFSIRINGDAIPDAVQGGFVADLLALAERHGIPDAITATGGIAPVPQFNELRHRELTVAQNEAAEAAGLGTRVTLRIR